MNILELRQLEYFITIVQEGSITKAAKKLHMTQPPLSHQIKKLEEDLGEVLFYRKNNKMYLTEVGEFFLLKSKEIVSLSKNIKKEIKEFDDQNIGSILIGITPTSIPLIFNNELKSFLKDNPRIVFDIYEGDTPFIYNLLNKGVINIGIVRSPFKKDNVNTIIKNPENMCVAMIDCFNWSKKKDCSIEDLDGKKIIIYHRYQKDLENSFFKNNVNPNIVCVCNSSSTTLRLAELGMGIAILPKSAIKQSNEHIVYKEILDDNLTSSTMAIWIKNNYLSKAEKSFLEFFTKL
ncbi:LysR family transcriptional regulator [Peptoniphilus sp. SGI.035]